MGNSDLVEDDDTVALECHEDAPCGSSTNNGGGSTNVAAKEKKGWFNRKKKGSKEIHVGPCGPETAKSPSGSLLGSGAHASSPPRSSSESDARATRKGNDKHPKADKRKKGAGGESKLETEYKRGLKPVLWLTPDFPLKTEELLPLLDILANKVKAVRRLRELLTTKLPHGTFPVKVAIPIVPTIRVLVTFTKFEDFQATEEFSTPLSSPDHFHDTRAREPEGPFSWLSWMRGSSIEQTRDGESLSYKDDIDPFTIPLDYTWIDTNEKRRRMKIKKAKNRKPSKHPGDRGGHGGSSGMGQL